MGRFPWDSHRNDIPMDKPENSRTLTTHLCCCEIVAFIVTCCLCTCEQTRAGGIMFGAPTHVFGNNWVKNATFTSFTQVSSLEDRFSLLHLRFSYENVFFSYQPIFIRYKSAKNNMKNTKVGWNWCVFSWNVEAWLSSVTPYTGRRASYRRTPPPSALLIGCCCPTMKLPSRASREVAGTWTRKRSNAWVQRSTRRQWT